ncbi:481_t:CDS:1, partial [Dentiscutata erythropus]
MDRLDQIVDITDLRRYSCCSKHKRPEEFTRFYRGEEQELDTCNNCSDKRKKKSSKSNINEDFETSEISNQFDYQDESNDLEDSVLYELNELEELVAMHFANEESQEIKFLNTFEFEDKLIDNSQVLNDNIEVKIRKL